MKSPLSSLETSEKISPSAKNSRCKNEPAGIWSGLREGVHQKLVASLNKRVERRGNPFLCVGRPRLARTVICQKKSCKKRVGEKGSLVRALLWKIYDSLERLFFRLFLFFFVECGILFLPLGKHFSFFVEFATTTTSRLQLTGV